MSRHWLILPAAATAIAAPVAARAQDARPITVETYSRDHVAPLAVAPGYATLIELAPDESVETVVIGDGAAWQVTPTSQGNRVVVKPTGAAAATDLIITTATRRYVFLLTTAGDGDAGAFVLRFEYPDTVASRRVIAARYDLHGAAELFPTEMSDDGARTSIMWRSPTPLPAVFALDGAGKETIVNRRMVGTTCVIEGVAARYIFRRGKKKAFATRRAVDAVR